MNNIFNPMQNNQMNMFNNINNNQFQQMKSIKPINNNNIVNNLQEPKKEIYSLIFKNSSGMIIVIQCLSDDKLSSVFDKYEAKIGFSGKKKAFNYVYNDCVLNPSESVKDANLKNLSNIVVVNLNNDVIGG